MDVKQFAPMPKEIGKRFAAMAWFQAISIEIARKEKLDKALTAGQMGKRYVPDIVSSEHESKIFYKYRNGSAFPLSHHQRIEIEFIHLETLWLFGDLFDLIDNRLLSNLDLMKSFSSSKINEATRGDYWSKGFNFLALREDEDWIKIFDTLREINNLEAFTGAVLVLRQCQVAYRRGFVYQYGCFVLLDMWQVIYSHPVLGPFAENLFCYLEGYFFPRRVPMDVTGNRWVEVSDAHTQRIQEAKTKINGWKPENATIPSPWYTALLRYFKRREYLARAHLSK